MQHKMPKRPIAQDSGRRPATYDSGFEHSLEHLVQVQQLVSTAAKPAVKSLVAKAS
jgi:hypothetical protein